MVADWLQSWQQYSQSDATMIFDPKLIAELSDTAPRPPKPKVTLPQAVGFLVERLTPHADEGPTLWEVGRKGSTWRAIEYRAEDWTLTGCALGATSLEGIRRLLRRLGCSLAPPWAERRDEAQEVWR